jgi:DNA-binding NtrC family response regulator
LIVDDEEPIRELVRQTLGGAGHQVADAGSGQAAMDLLERRRFDLVILDYALPDTTGAALAGRIRERLPEQKLLIFSGYAGTIMVREQAGDIPLVGKPCRSQELLDAVDRALV